MSTSPSPRRLLLTVGGLLAVGVAASLGLAACSGIDIAGPHGRESVAFRDMPTALKSDESFRLPALLPEDASDIRLRYDLQTTGAWFRFDSPGGITADYCHTSDLSGDPDGDAAWWPDDVPAHGFECGNWKVFSADDHWYAWDARDTK
jgi:hypothetical protein